MRDESECLLFSRRRRRSARRNRDRRCDDWKFKEMAASTVIGLQVTQKNVRMITGLGFHFSLLS